MEESPVLGAQDLVLAVFRLAVADYLGICYGHDDPGPNRRTTPRFKSDAEAFLRGCWAAYLGDLVGLSAGVIWREVVRLNVPDSRGSRAA